MRDAERYRMGTYAKFQQELGSGVGAGGVIGNTEATRIPQAWIVGDVDHCVRQLTDFITEFGITDVVTWAVPPGLRPERMNASLELLFRDVVPRVRAAVA